MSAITKKQYFFNHEPYRIVTKDKKLKWIHDSTVIVRDENGQIVNFVGYLSDITELKEHELKLIDISRIDQLTKIPNRLFLDEVLKKQYYRFTRSKEECSIIILDIDLFKRVNDNYGHLVGDMILIEFAKILTLNVRESDTVGRWGGEEFMIILPHTKKKDGVRLANKLKDIINTHIFPSVADNLTSSFGVSGFVKNISLDTTIRLADEALYEAKKNGRNQVCVK